MSAQARTGMFVYIDCVYEIDVPRRAMLARRDVWPAQVKARLLAP